MLRNRRSKKKKEERSAKAIAARTATHNMKIETEETVDFVILLQFALANTEDGDDVRRQLVALKPYWVTLDMTQKILLLNLILASLPSLTDIELVDLLFYDLVNTRPETVDRGQSPGPDHEFVDAYSLFKNKDDIPSTLKNLLGLEFEFRKLEVEKLLDSAIQTAFKYNCDLNIAMTTDEIYQAVTKSWIFRINDEFSCFSVTTTYVRYIIEKRGEYHELIKWINGLYMPLSVLSLASGCDYTLSFYENIMSISEKIDLIMTTASGKKTASRVIDDVLVPYLEYVGKDSWDCFNGWLSKFGNFSVNTTDEFKIIQNYEFLLNLLRNDGLLKIVDKQEPQIKDMFVSSVIAIIYLSPKAILQVFISAKEILTLLKSLKLASTETVNFVELQSCDQFEDVSRKITPSYGTIDALINIISVGEILYSNELSLPSIIALENADKAVQTEQLSRYINNEVKYESSERHWSLFLSSLFSALKKTNVFNKISTEELSGIILVKLLELKQYDVIKNCFSKDYNHIPEDKYYALIEKQCWIFYMNATNCDPSIGSLNECTTCLQLLDPGSAYVQAMNSLIEANAKILEWKFYLKYATPVTPKDIYETKNPMIIIRRILELNEKAYLYPGDLYFLLSLLIQGLDCEYENPLYQSCAHKSYYTKNNLLAVKLKLVCLEFASVSDFNFSLDLSMELMNTALEEKNDNKEIFDVVRENWITIFQLAKNEYDEPLRSNLLERKLKLLSKLILVTPTEFNTKVLEQWQILNVEKSHIGESVSDETENGESKRPLLSIADPSLGDVQARLRKSLKSSADELLNSNGADIGKNIIGWIVGANQ